MAQRAVAKRLSPAQRRDGTETKMTATQQITPATIAYDARRCITEYRSAQRFSVERDSWVVLTIRCGFYELSDSRSGQSYTLAREYTDEARLTAHWAGFLASHKANC